MEAPGGALRKMRLHAPPSSPADSTSNPQRCGYPAPDRVTFLTAQIVTSLNGGDTTDKLFHLSLSVGEWISFGHFLIS
jgi:hypothetical protein